MNGKLKLPLLFGKYLEVTGGPYWDKPKGMIGVKMAEEIMEFYTVSIPVKDFGIPTKEQMDKGLYEAIIWVVSGKPVYVGCMGGIGRTGLMLAILAKAFGVKDPIMYVRANYSKHAVETRNQEEFVGKYSIPLRVKVKVAAKKVSSIMSLKRSLTTNLLTN